MDNKPAMNNGQLTMDNDGSAGVSPAKTIISDSRRDAGAPNARAEKEAKAVNVRRQKAIHFLDDFFYYRRGFELFCRECVMVEDADTRKAVPFNFWPCQERVAGMLCNGDWLCVLKTRRIGMTWLLAAYTVWKATFHPRQTVVVVNQSHEYAADFLDRCRFIHAHLPSDLQHVRTRDSLHRLEFGVDRHGAQIRSVACTRRAIHSLTANLVIFDEAARMELFKEARHAAQPAVEVKGGQIVVLSTSNGPRGEFYELCGKAMDAPLPRPLPCEGRGETTPLPRPLPCEGRGETTPVLPLSSQERGPGGEVHCRYRFLFFDWRNRPGRDAKWYAREKADNEGDPLFMKRQFPSSPEECFESAQGRVYQCFTQHGPAGQLFIRKIETHPDWKH